MASYASSTFNFLRNLHIISCSGCNNLHSHHSALEFPILHIFAITLDFFIFLWQPKETGVMHYLIVVLIWIALIIRDIEHLFMYLLAIFLLRKSLLMTSAHYFSIGLFVFFFFPVDLHEFFIYFRYLPLIRYMICKLFVNHFLSFNMLLLHFVGGFLCYSEAF